MVFRNGNGKNGSDIALTIGAMELLQTQSAEMIVIVSSDSDFAPLAQKIVNAGRIAIGIGRENASEDLRKAFDRYLILPPASRVAAPAPEPAKAAAPDTSPPVQSVSQTEGLLPEQVRFLAELVTRLAAKDPDGTVLLSHLGLALRKEYPALGEKLAKGRLRKALKQHDLADEYGEGTSIKGGAASGQTAPNRLSSEALRIRPI